MPSPFTSSFASAAASNASEGGPSTTRNSGSGDWSRARTNGSTTTFRRPSGANALLQRNESISNSTNHAAPGSVYIPPHAASNYASGSGRNGSMADTRYSKDQLLELFRAQQESDSQPNLEDLFVDGWSPKMMNSANSSGWGRGDDRRESQGTDICWDHEGSVQPLGFIPMSDEEKELFSNSVNSPIKPPTQNKDGTPNTPGLNRRTSLSQSQGNTNTSRPGGRQRRDSSDILGNTIISPTTSRFSKEDPSATSPPPSLVRRKTDLKDAFGPRIEDREKDANRPTIDTTSPIGTLKRTATNPLSAALNGPSSPWSTGPASAGFAPMGAFGSFGAPQSATDRKQGFGRSESRFKSLMGGGSSEDMKKPKDQNLRRVSGSADDSVRSPWDNGPSQRTGLGDLFEDESQPPAGSAALGGEDASPPTLQPSRSRNFESQSSIDELGFSSVGIGSNIPLQDVSQRSRHFSHQQPQQQQSHSSTHFGEPLSPTFTNPYQSPEGEKAVPRDFDANDDHLQYTQAAPFGRGFPISSEQAGDRSQTSSTGAGRGFPSLTGLGNLGALNNGPWSAAPGAVGTPSRAFGDSPFGSMTDIGSQNTAGFGSAGFFGSGPPTGGSMAATTGRGSRLGSFLPGGMQDLRNDPHRQDQGIHDLDGSAKANRARLDDILTGVNQDDRFRGPLTSTQPPPSAPLQPPFSATTKPNNYFSGSQDPDLSSNQLPASQQRQMVMPDRMRWIYRDPQGNQQGPWSGLEMHDWYKAGFFSPELQVKKLEDSDYEPLAQLIRRIGNSREPFLVPQIGIPHGDPPAAGPPTGQATAQPGASNSAQPPFASSFPSFGTTLTAEQQNALERRKQEEQYLMARQKEHLAAMQPAMQRQMQQHIHNQQLNHHSSAQSLQSQPSYGSITSPGGYQQTPGTGPVQSLSGQSLFENMPRNVASEAITQREEQLPGFVERMNLARGGAAPYGNNGPGQEQFHQQQIDIMLQEKARLQREQQRYDTSQRTQDDDRASVERFEEFQRLRAQEAEQQRLLQPSQRAIGDQMEQYQSEAYIHDERPNEQLSLSEQVQKTQNESTMPQPFPPAQSSSPMPAPTPQRNRQSVAEALNAESRAHTSPQPDSADTPSASMAPWAKDTNEVSKGPSLKEIQAIEAKKAAQQEELAAAARRAATEQERVTQHAQPVPPAPGLPSSANWASSVSPAVPAPSPWTKPTGGKPTVATPTAGAKKTLAQIQREEEARKSKAAVAAAASNPISPAPGLGGKRYADLASKTTSGAPPNPNNAAWTTVGAGGKVKAPPAAPATATRTASGNISTVPAKAKGAPSAAVAGTAKPVGNHNAAHEEFQKWIRNALGKGLNSGIPVDDFISSLMSLPLEPDIISDSIYASSQTLDGRRFAEEFVKRRKQADRGVTLDPSTGSFSSSTPGDAKTSGNGGWSEVAKKGSQGGSSAQAERTNEFKVVAGKKKAKR